MKLKIDGMSQQSFSDGRFSGHLLQSAEFSSVFFSSLFSSGGLLVSSAGALLVSSTGSSWHEAKLKAS
jgi:hypothetical protein